MRHLLIIITLAVLYGTACASLRPAVPVQQATGEDAEPELSVMEGRPDSLLLRVAFRDAREGETLQLVRARGDADEAVLVVLELTGNFLKLTRESYLGLSDDGVEPGVRYAYRVDVVGERGVIASSGTLTVEWGVAPKRPEGLVVRELSAGVVEVVWRPNMPAAVFMRDVLRPDSPTNRFDVEAVAGGRWIIRGLEPEGVYAFRVALGRKRSSFVRYGVPSEEVYLTMGEVSGEGKR